MLKKDVGQYVTILDPIPLSGHKDYSIDREMEQYSGKRTEIIGIENEFNENFSPAYRLEIDNGRFFWIDSMLVDE